MTNTSHSSLSKLDLAIKLTKPQKIKDNEIKLTKKQEEDLNKGINLFNRLCLSATLTPTDKYKVITAYVKSVPSEGLDMISRYRDMIPFLKGNDLKDLLELLSCLTRSPDIDSHQRLTTAVTLYNQGYINLCYNCFADICCDRQVLVKYRVDASRYLFGSLNEDHKEVAQESLIEVIETEIYPSDYRYSVIASFISRTGINTMMNMTKIRVPYDEEFVYALQTNFFYNKVNGIRERILSGQHMLQMKCVETKEKNEIFKSLLKIAEDKKLDENIRADAADVVHRLATNKLRNKARALIVELGHDTTENLSGTGSIIDRTNTIYNNSQNIHEFTSQVDKFIEKIINETNIKLKPYHQVHKEITDLVRDLVKDKTERFRAYKALNRISVDTAKFTKYRATLAEIFIHVWIRIEKHSKKEQTMLKKRMIEELVDMGETCSSGHSGRFVNVLSSVDNTLKISWFDQIKANMAGRMNARIRDCKDEELRGHLAMANSDLADEEDKKVYTKFIEENLKKLHKELFKEFVGEGYTTKEVFKKAFEASKKRWL